MSNPTHAMPLIRKFRLQKTRRCRAIPGGPPEWAERGTPREGARAGWDSLGENAGRRARPARTPPLGYCSHVPGGRANGGMGGIATVVILVAGQTLPEIARRRGDFERFIRTRAGAGPRVRWVARDLRGPAPLPGPRDADAFVMTGSSSSVTERASWMLRAEELLRQIVAARTPFLGICFGHQMMAQALGGEVRSNPRGREIGTVRLERSGRRSALRGPAPQLRRPRDARRRGDTSAAGRRGSRDDRARPGGRVSRRRPGARRPVSPRVRCRHHARLRDGAGGAHRRRARRSRRDPRRASTMGRAAHDILRNFARAVAGAPPGT